MKEESIKLNNNENTGDTLSHTIERSLVRIIGT